VTSQEQIILTWLITKKDIDVNENERISKITLKTQIKLKEELFIAVLHFTDTIESSIMNRTHYNMSVKQPLSFRSSSTAPILQVEQHSPYPSGRTAQPLSFRSNSTAPILQVEQHSPYPSGRAAQPLSFRSNSTAPILQVEQHSPYPSGRVALFTSADKHSTCLVENEQAHIVSLVLNLLRL
jgi:hypothetical protein